jgi:hypothetical protein
LSIERKAKALKKEAAVWQCGQIIMKGQIARVFLALLGAGQFLPCFGQQSSQTGIFAPELNTVRPPTYVTVSRWGE